MLFSVIIVSYLNYDVLSECLDSIKRYNDIGDELEVIVSDNSPSNDLINRIRANYPWVKTCKNENKGFGAGNNRGAEISTGKFLLFLNPDTTLVEPIFMYAINRFEEDSDLALFGVKLIGPDGSLRPSYIYLDVNDYPHQLLMNRVYIRNDKYNDKNMMIVGADIFIRRQVFIDAGMFDENIFMYYEECDLKRRVMRLSPQYYSNYFPVKKIVHIEGGTEESNQETLLDKTRRAMESYHYYCSKWNIPFNKEVNKMIRSNMIKKILTIIQRKTKDQYMFYDRLNNVYLQSINKYN